MNTTAAHIANEIRATTLDGIARFANDYACLSEINLDDIGQAAIASFGTFYTFDVTTHRSADTADFVLSLTIDQAYELLAALVNSKATSPRKVGDFLYNAAKNAA